MTQLFDNLIDRFRRGFDWRGAGSTAETAITSPISLVQVEVDERNTLELDVLPDIDFRPIQQRMDPDVCPGRKRGLELIPELRRLITEIPVAMLIARGKIAFFRPGAFLVRPNPQDDRSEERRVGKECRIG